MPDTPEKPDTPEEPSPKKDEEKTAGDSAVSNDAASAESSEEPTAKSGAKKRTSRPRKKAPAKLDTSASKEAPSPNMSGAPSSADPQDAKDDTKPAVEDTVAGGSVPSGYLSTDDMAKPDESEPETDAKEDATPSTEATPADGPAPAAETSAEPASSDSTPPPPVEKQSRNYLGIGALAAILIAGGVAVWTYPWGQPLPRVDDNAAFTAIGSRLNDLEARVGKLEAADPTPVQDGSDLTELREQVEALAQQMAALGASSETPVQDSEAADGEPAGAEGQPAPAGRLAAALDLIADLEARIDQIDAGGAEALQQRLQAVEGLIADTDAAGRLDSVETGLASAVDQSQFSDIEQRVVALETGNDAQVMRAASLAMAVANLSRAAAGSTPFVHELTVVQALAPDQPQLAALAAHAPTGLPTIAALRSEFPAFGRAAIRADRVAGATSWWESLLANLQSMITVRDIEETEGDTVTAIVSRIETLLVEGRLNDALLAAGSLSPAAQEAIAPWLNQARPRADLEAAIANLNADVLAAIAASGGSD